MFWGGTWKNQNPRFSFASTAHVTQWSSYLIISTGLDFDLTIKFNASTGEDYCEWFVSGVCGTDIKQVGFTVSSLIFPRPASCSRQFTPNGSNFAQHFTAAQYTEKKKYLMKWDFIDILALPFANRQNCSHNRAAKHIKNLLSSLIESHHQTIHGLDEYFHK